MPPLTFRRAQSQRGVVTLFMILIVAVILSGIALQTGQTGFATQRLANNEYHATQSMAAAQGGIDYMLASLRQDPASYLDSSGAIKTVTTNGVVGPVTLNRIIDVTTGKIASTSSNSGIGFSVALASSTVVANGIYTIVIKSTGCASALCSPANPEAKTITQAVSVTLTNTNFPGLLIRGAGQDAKNSTYFGGQLVVSNTRGGPNVLTDTNLIGSLPITSSKTSLATENNDTLLARYFTRTLAPGMTLMSTIQNESAKRNTLYQGNTGLDKLASDWKNSHWSDSHPSPPYWVQGNLTLTANTVIGNEDTDPVVIVVTGDCLTSANGVATGATITGLLICLGNYKRSNINDFNSLTVRVSGHVAVGGVMQINWGTMQIDNVTDKTRDNRLYAKLGPTGLSAKITRLPAQWKDYPA